MPECLNCGAHVTAAYVQVFSAEKDAVDACPRCPDKVREKGRPREARSARDVS